MGDFCILSVLGFSLPSPPPDRGIFLMLCPHYSAHFRIWSCVEFRRREFRGEKLVNMLAPSCIDPVSFSHVLLEGFRMAGVCSIKFLEAGVQGPDGGLRGNKQSEQRGLISQPGEGVGHLSCGFWF